MVRHLPSIYKALGPILLLYKSKQTTILFTAVNFSKTAPLIPLGRGQCHFSWAPGLLVKHRAKMLILSLGNVLWLICITITRIRKATDWSIPCQIMIALWMTPLSCLWTAASGAQSPHSSRDWNYPLQPLKFFCKRPCQGIFPGRTRTLPVPEF